MTYLLAFDQGTTGSRSIIFDSAGKIVSMAQKELTQFYPQIGWIEHDPLEIRETQIAAATECLQKSKLKSSDIVAVGITNQRETVVVWEKQTGKPIYPAIVWQDRRTTDFCDAISKNYSDLIREKTGLEVDAYFSASKIKWILDNVPDARSKADAGELACGTIDSWLIWNLTGGEKHLTDVSNASRTMLFNINSLKWDADLLKIFDVPPQILPEIKSSSEIYGEISSVSELNGLKIAGIAGDQQAALFGQMCLQKGATKCTYGTGCFMLQNVGEKSELSSNRLLTTIAWQIGDLTEYALEGSVFIGGAVVGWLRDGLRIIENSAEVENLANSAADNGGVYFVPAFTGLGAPHWNQNARGIIVGLTRGTTRAHIARAALEAICFQTADLLDAMQSDTDNILPELKVDGGATKNDSLMQMQADISQIPVVRSEITETTALGAAYLAGLAVGVWKNKSELIGQQWIDRIFTPRISADEAKNRRRRWSEAVRRSLDWAN